MGERGAARAYSRNCQTCTASPAEPGELPWLLEQSGCFQGGSAIGEGICVRKRGAAASLTAHLTGYFRVVADSLDDAKSMLAGNPLYEAGGTVEIRELPRTD
jgi:hypothetical protein